MSEVLWGIDNGLGFLFSAIKLFEAVYVILAASLSLDNMLLKVSSDIITKWFSPFFVMYIGWFSLKHISEILFVSLNIVIGFIRTFFDILIPQHYYSIIML